MIDDHRIERDSLGELPVPADAYYGVHTARAVANFRITGTTIGQYPALVSALASVKMAACEANRVLGRLDDRRADAIATACAELRVGRFLDQFPVDPIQGGAGTSSNMNANEVIANRALEILGHPRGAYTEIDPITHVNLGQSTNDVYPTAVRLALVAHIRELTASLDGLARSFAGRADAFADVIKMGRTQLQDAVPMTLGQEFAAYATTVRENRDRLAEGALALLECNLGGTAIGTGINGHPDYPALACRYLREITGEPVAPAADRIAATSNCGDFVQISGLIKRVAVELSKICNDRRLLASGPAAGLGAINLPAAQAGSSIMPGKVNPVVPELVNQVAFEAIGNDLTVTLAAEGGQLQLNAFEPIIAYSLLRTLSHLTAAADTLAAGCVDGITANRDHLAEEVHRSAGLVTALAPYLGYAACARVAKQALRSGRSVAEIVVAEGLLDRDRVAELLAPRRLAGLPPAANVAPVLDAVVS
ncbi:aspartate ammonia-lyase [Nocardia sp. alder85J]|uniref:aspartate ammonia-lyase n=1 Tax=Nocardia sp. alder85J TaxID=2862949 RepID=UPI001CD2E634|nr:aspartate ammonia-lyase [Nocardia sp. alder85J]MCX4091100.1 aspartate ammonia-lyase [Nocardia sp. alder85J]